MSQRLQWLWKFSIVLFILSIFIVNGMYVYVLASNNKPYSTIGIPGASGRDGISIIGPQGLTGATGKSGINGENGQNGTNGVAGSNGSNGLSGKDGIDGMNGKTPELRCFDDKIQWRYVNETNWNDLSIATCPESIKATEAE